LKKILLDSIFNIVIMLSDFWDEVELILNAFNVKVLTDAMNTAKGILGSFQL